MRREPIRFKHIFSPGRIGSLVTPNRLVFAATSSELADADGFATDEMVEYYAERARGGVGLIILEATYVEQEGKRLHHNAMLHHDRYIEGLRKIVEAVHVHGTKIGIQLNHGGRESISTVSGSVPLAPSALPSDFTGVGESIRPRELTAREIGRIVDRFVEAALRACRAGFDLVELHGAHGYLVGQFLSPAANKRTDCYGGSTSGRARFALELLMAIKSRLSQSFPVAIRINGSDFIPGGLEVQEAVQISSLLEAAGADAISVSGGIHASRPYMIVPGMSVPRGCFVEFSAAVRRSVNIPIMTVGRINTPELADDTIAGQYADFVCLSRALIADPHFPKKAEMGLQQTIVPCIACNECISTVHKHKGLACTVNPNVSRELELRPLWIKPTLPKRIAILGSGAAGMAAAITASRRGHAVFLFAISDKLGGQLNLASAPPNREEIGVLLEFLKSELARQNVSVRIGYRASTRDVKELGAGAVIVATGATAVLPSIPGSNFEHVLMGWRVLSGEVVPGQSCVVVDGGLVGVEVADYLAERGKSVTLIARSDLLKKARRSSLLPRSYETTRSKGFYKHQSSGNQSNKRGLKAEREVESHVEGG
jgi:2,4-dienoyl-CoA reductase-like NADH-dependent reductase (Old Yellow Enzyme family)